MEIDDSEFYQQDFTTASEWEIFNARLDEIFLDWKLPYIENGNNLKKNELFQTKWDIRSVSIFFANEELKVSHYHAKIEGDEREKENDSNNVLENETKESFQNKIPQAHSDLISLENNFCTCDSDRLHPIVKWYGLRDFVVIEPVNGPINASQYRVVLSSACMTAVETNTEIPVFVRVMQKELNVYLGVCESLSRRINFDIVALENTPPTCKYLSGLLLMFKGKISENYLNPVTVSVQFSYSLKEFCSRSYCLKSKIPFSNDQDQDDCDLDYMENENEKFFALPYGVSLDPISELILNCTWNEIAENVLVDSATYSDLDPMLALIWSLHCNYKQQAIYYLTDSLNDYIKLAESNRTIVSILGSSYDFAGVHNLEGGNPLALLTESKIPNLSSMLPSSVRGKKKTRENKNIDGAIKEDELMRMLYYLFPDAEKEPEHPYLIDDQTEIFDPMKIKSAAPDSLVFRLSCLLATCYSYFGGLSGMAQLWAEFTQEMRYRVERSIQIPGVATGFPDSRLCLLHQKLQMLNICMDRRRLREGAIPFSMTESKGVIKKLNKHEDSDDEFYDCDSDEENDNETVHEPWNKPEGRLEKLENLMLIDSNEPLYIPICQEPVPKTEDQLEDDAEVMLKLGPGSDLGAQMMSASLLSDMESFKAANPNGKIEDFIRWYSPRDWIVETNELGEMIGKLSQRMLIPENTWQVVWQQAKPVSARRQKQLFDDAKEAEKVLHFFETRTIGQICELTIACIFHSSILKLQDELNMINMLDLFQINVDRILAILCKISRDIWILKADPPTHYNSTPKKYEKLLNEIANLENIILQSRSLTKKLFSKDINLLDNNEKSIIANILKGCEAELENGAKNPISVQVLNLFSDARESKDEFNLKRDGPSQLYLPEPNRKEYILRLNGRTTNGEGGPQFLRAILDKHMRLCGAFSENTTFVQ